jgi:hypothetical protein
MEKRNNLNIMLRAPTPDDTNFVIKSWMESSHASDFAVYIPDDIWYDKHKKVITNLIERSLISVLCDTEDPTHMLGFTVYEIIEDVLILHFLYIKYPYRNFGFSKQILQSIYPKFKEQDFFITHIDRTVLRVKKNYKGDQYVDKNSWFLKNKEKFKMHYNPYLMIRG